MAYTHLTMEELGWIDSYHTIGLSASKIAERLERSKQPICNVITYLKRGHTIQDYYARYKKNKRKCGARRKTFTDEEIHYVKDSVASGWTPDVIVGRKEMDLQCSMRTLYRRFEDSSVFDQVTLPMNGKRKPNGHKEKRGKQAFKRSLQDRDLSYPVFKHEFGHLEGDTIIGEHHKSAVITLVERLSKLIITLKPKGRKAADIEDKLSEWFYTIPSHLFKSITFDCGKEFSNWKTVSDRHDISIFFADSGCPSQPGLNEQSNGLLRRDELPKQMDFNKLDQTFISSVSNYRKNIPRKSLNYRTPIEVFIEHVPEW